MIFSETYKCLDQNVFEYGNYKIVPLRYSDRIDIMNWRNDQMYHLRQSDVLTLDNQENYFSSVVAKLFGAEQPSQLLFSYLKNEICIGYGGLVHINWEDKKAEVSFIMETQLEKDEFEIHWTNFLKLLKKVAFSELKFNKIFTYAYNLRPHLYPALEKNQFQLKDKLIDEIEIEGKMVDVLIHECINPILLLKTRNCTKEDKELIYNWSNDKLVRSQSFNSDEITEEGHEKWFTTKLENKNSLLLINEFESKPAGLVRFEMEESNSVIGILIDSEHRGKGLSSLMLIKSSSKYFELFEKPILAYIKESNVASIRAFEKAEFKFFKNTIINEIPTLVYKLDKK